MIRPGLVWRPGGVAGGFFMPGVSLYHADIIDGVRGYFRPCGAPPFSGYSRTPRGWRWTGSAAGGIAARGIKKGPLIADRARALLYLFFPKRYYSFDIARGIVGNFYALDADGGRRQV